MRRSGPGLDDPHLQLQTGREQTPERHDRLGLAAWSSADADAAIHRLQIGQELATGKYFAILVKRIEDTLADPALHRGQPSVLLVAEQGHQRRLHIRGG